MTPCDESPERKKLKEFQEKANSKLINKSMRLGDSSFTYHKNRPASAEPDSPKAYTQSKVNSRQITVSRGQSQIQLARMHAKSANKTRQDAFSCTRKSMPLNDMVADEYLQRPMTQGA